MGGTTDAEIKDYLNSHPIPKILSTYDSIYRMNRFIKDKSDWRLVMDEFHVLLGDAAMKSETEMKVLKIARSYPFVTFMSATPIEQEFLLEIDELKDLPYYEVMWEEKEMVYVDRQKHAKPLNAALGIVKNYMAGNFASRLDENGNRIYSKECVIFLNSVKTIISIIKQSGVRPEQVNIIMGQSEDNDKLLEKECPRFHRGHVPTREEKNKMITFCTSTAYAGCDFYSDSASTFVICDCSKKNTSVDISTELVQIAGR